MNARARTDVPNCGTAMEFDGRLLRSRGEWPPVNRGGTTE